MTANPDSQPRPLRGPMLWVPALALVLAAAGGAIWLARRIEAILRRARAAEALHPETRTPASVDELPASPDFRIGTPGRDPAPTIGAADSPEAARFKESLRNLYAVDVAERAIEIPVRRPLELSAITTTMIAMMAA